MPTFFARATLALVVCLGAAPASAAPETLRVTVRTSDLDLATPAGTGQLRRRIATALNEVCGAVDRGDFLQSVAIRACRTKALRDATPQVALATARHSATAADAGKANPAS